MLALNKYWASKGSLVDMTGGCDASNGGGNDGGYNGKDGSIDDIDSGWVCW